MSDETMSNETMPDATKNINEKIQKRNELLDSLAEGLEDKKNNPDKAIKDMTVAEKGNQSKRLQRQLLNERLTVGLNRLNGKELENEQTYKAIEQIKQDVTQYDVTDDTENAE